MLLLRLYAAVRDRNWTTIPATVTPVEQTILADSFRIVYDADHRQGDLHFVWRGTLTGAPDGAISFTFVGEARTTFERNRIGFCILHPAECAGVPCTVEHEDGTSTETVFPEYLIPEQPVPPFAQMRAMMLRYEDGLRVRLEMQGDLFEMEDQRNWTDASYKTFCTPLHLPFPVTLKAGTRITQHVTLQLEPTGATRSYPVRSVTEPARTVLELSSTPISTVPPIGLGQPDLAPEITADQLDRLRALNPAHLSVELRMAEAGWQEEFARGAQAARLLGTPMELVLRLPDEPTDVMEALIRLLAQTPVPSCRLLALPAQERLTRAPAYAALLRAAKQASARAGSDDWIATGTRSDFIFVNRFPPPDGPYDALTFAINPQVHAFDDASLMETLATQAVVMKSARRLAAGRPVVVSPVTLLPRFNPYATAPQPWSRPPADPRQISLFGAVWTLGSIKYLAEGGAAAITYYETHGLGGVMDAERVFPLYHVLADVNAFRGGAILGMHSSAPLAAIGLAMRIERRLRILIANLTSQEQAIQLHGVPDAITTIGMRVLSEATAATAMTEPETFRAHRMPQDHRGGDLTLVLPPYATTCLDAEESE